MLINEIRILHPSDLILRKLALIGCFSSKNWYSFAPLLATLEERAVFEKYDVFFLNRRPNSAIAKIIVQHDVTIFAYSFYTHEAPRITAEIERIKTSFPPNQLLFLAGGAHPSGNPSQTLRLGFDLAVIGEGEEIFPILLDQIANNQDYSDLKGICFAKNGQIHQSPPSTLNKLDEYPTFSRSFNLYPPLEISRGCPFGCKYCEVSYLFGRKMRHRSIETILNIVKAYQKKFSGRRSTDIRFITPNSLAYGSPDGRTPNPAKITRLLKSIYSLGKGSLRIFFASFPSETRPEFITSSILEEISPYLSNENIAFGGQSGSDRVLKLIGRNHTVEDIRNATAAILETERVPLVDFLLGLPVETDEDQYLTMDLIKELIKQKAKIRIHYFMPLAGTPFEKESSVPIKRAILSELGRLAKKGHVEGNLYTQIRKSTKIQRFLKSL